MREISLKRLTHGYAIIIDGKPAHWVQWTPAKEQDLFIYHGLNLEAEIIRAIFEQLERYALTEEEKLELVRLITSTKETS